MNILRRLRLFLFMDIHTKVFYFEAWVMLGLARMQTLRPFAKVAPSLGQHMEETSIADNVLDRATIRNISSAIQVMSKYTPWQSQCMVRAIAGMRMLSRRGYESTLYFGTGKDESGQFIAHAWLRSGAYYISGAENKDQFTVVSTFATARNIKKLDLSTLPAELTFLLQLFQNEGDKGQIKIAEDLLTGLNWEQVLAYARHHRIHPVLYVKLKQWNRITSLIPPNIIQTLQMEYQQNTLQMLRLSGEMDEINRLLRTNHIRALFIKGPIVAESLYGDISLRTSCDLDILIPMKDLDRTEVLLKAQGYVKDEYIQSILGDWKWRHHHCTYIHPEKGIKLEIHWRLHAFPWQEPSFERLWEHKRENLMTGSSIYYLSETDLFVYLVCHGARHGWSRLRWLMDIDRLIAHHPDWASIERSLRRNKATHIGGKAVFLAEAMFHSSIPDQLKLRLYGPKAKRLAQDTMFYLSRMIHLHDLPLPEDISRYHKRYLFSLMSMRQKLVFILSFLYPYPQDVQTLQLPDKLHFLYFPLRPMLWFWRKVTRQQEVV